MHAQFLPRALHTSLSCAAAAHLKPSAALRHWKCTNLMSDGVRVKNIVSLLTPFWWMSAPTWLRKRKNCGVPEGHQHRTNSGGTVQQSDAACTRGLPHALSQQKDPPACTTPTSRLH